MMTVKYLRLAATCALVLSLFVVMLGAYTRLTNAGLGCPDWPGCYGHMVLPMNPHDLSKAQSHYPQDPVETVKAWTEMAHRYAAGTLAILILGIALGVSGLARNRIRLPWMLPIVMLLLVAFQATLGMWTVTLKLLPVVVMGHLLGGILIFSSLCYFRWQISAVSGHDLPKWRAWIALGLVIVFCQIALGGWVSSNYAGIACIGFPRCNGQWFPALDLSHAFNLFSSVGANYQGGLLNHDARMTIQFVHRLGACITAIYVFLLSGFILMRVKAKPVRIASGVAMLLVVAQFGLGIVNVVYLLPLWAAVAHNGLAALLLATMISLYYLAKKGAAYAG